MFDSAESVIEELTQITMSDGVDIYVVARTLIEGFKKGENFKVDSLGNRIDKFTDGYSVQVIPNIQMETGKEVVSVIKFCLENKLVLTIIFIEKGFVIGFVNHFKFESDCRMFCREMGFNTYVDHAFNIKNQALLLALILPHNYTEREIMAMESRLHPGGIIKPNLN